MKLFSNILLAGALVMVMTEGAELFQGGRNIIAGIFFLCVGVIFLQQAGRVLDRKGA